MTGIEHKTNEVTLQSSKDAKFLDAVIEKHPYGLLDKGKPNCGGTDLAIKNRYPTIIAVPYRNLVRNKVAQHKHVLGVYGGIADAEIISYLFSHDTIKIMVTYDSVGRVVRLLGLYRNDLLKDMLLLIDEEHVLFNHYAFRNPAIKGLLKISRQFKWVCFMTATPIDREFMLDELKDLPITRIKWQDMQKVKVIQNCTNNPNRVVGKLITEALEGRLLGNLHFFYNSVDSPASIARQLELPPQQVRFICADDSKQGRGKKTNQMKLGRDYLIEDTTTPVKKINFYTATAFEGCDIYDENGRTYVVSDKYKSHTLVDISTLFIQIAGRIRNSRYSGEITHIFNETRYTTTVTYDEFKECTEKEWLRSELLVQEVNAMSGETRKTVVKGLMKAGLDIKYLSYENDLLQLDRNLFKLDMRNFKITHEIYLTCDSLQKEYKSRGLSIGESETIYFTDKLAANPKARIPFRDLFTEYVGLRNEQGMIFCLGNRTDRCALIEQEKPLVREAYEKLGADRVKELGYNTTNIKREPTKLTDASNNEKILEMLYQLGYTDSDFTKTCAGIKADLQEIYECLGIKKKAQATDLKQWFEVKRTSPKIEGKTTDCITIIRRKIIY